MREKWLDCVRGVSIIAVVTEHMMGSTHHTELVQSFTLFCVSVLIICMGISMRWGIERAIKKGTFRNTGIYVYVFRRMLPVLSAYIIASMAYTSYYQQWSGYDPKTIIEYLLNFNASPPFYFIRHFINLSFWAPLLFYVVYVISSINNVSKYLFYALFLIVTLCVGHASIGRAGYTSESYLFLYALGMVLGRDKGILGGGQKEAFSSPSLRNHHNRSRILFNI